MPPLAAPDPAGDLSVSSVRRVDAVQLFVDRARAARPEVTLTEANAASVARICWQLDGITLAIELAAARLTVFTAAQVADRLGDRFRLLTGGSRTAPACHRTLREMIDWSYDLLAEREPTLFRRLAVFAGGFDLEAAEAVCGGDPGDQMPREDVLPLLIQLADKSLVVIDATDAERARYRYLETIRAYATERWPRVEKTHSLVAATPSTIWLWPRSSNRRS